MKFRKSLSVPLVASCLAIFLTACGGSSESGTSTTSPEEFAQGSVMARLSDKGKIRVGTQATYPLIGVRKLGEYSGFDVEITKLIVKELGIEEEGIEFVPVTTPTREGFLRQDKVDMIVGAYTITKSRAKVVDFAGPYYDETNGVMVKAGNPENIESFADLAGKSKSLCAPAGSTPEAYIRKNHPDVADNLVLFGSSAKCAAAVKSGQVTASTTTDAILASFVEQNDGATEITGIQYGDSHWGIGVPKTQDKVFCEWINKTLESMYTSGEWAQAYNKTIGTVLGDAPKPPELASCRDLSDVAI